MKRKSIQGKLSQVFIFASFLIVVVNLIIFYNVNHAIEQIDNIYNKNLQLNHVSNVLEEVQENLFQYLNTKSSESLENYYLYEQEYSELIESLEDTISSDSTILMEKNIRNMSESYLQTTNNTIEAKRGRNITRYRLLYSESEKVYGYLNNAIQSINTQTFLKNSETYSRMRESLNVMMLASIFLLISGMLVAGAWVLLQTKRLIKPLRNLATVANEVSSGNMDIVFPVEETGDEIAIVAKAFNGMLDSIRLNIEQTKANLKRESKLKQNELIIKNDLKEAQLKYLQAQINPHFLFNTLNAGAQLAMMEDAEKTCLFIENMADFFRYNVRKAEKDTTLSEEIQLVYNYIYILNVRYQGDIQFSSQIDERYVYIRMPSMILQPIVENAVNHGIAGMEGAGKIVLSVYKDNNTLCISVKDNGKGINKEDIEKIMEGKIDIEKKEVDSTGIGVANVTSRLRQYFGTKEMVIIKSNEEEPGTEVIIQIPYKN